MYDFICSASASAGRGRGPAILPRCLLKASPPHCSKCPETDTRERERRAAGLATYRAPSRASLAAVVLLSGALLRCCTLLPWCRCSSSCGTTRARATSSRRSNLTWPRICSSRYACSVCSLHILQVVTPSHALTLLPFPPPSFHLCLVFRKPVLWEAKLRSVIVPKHNLTR